MNTTLAFFFLFPLLSFSKDYFIDKQKVAVEQIVNDKGVIWGMDFLSPDELLYTVRSGKLKLFNLKTKQTQEIIGAPKVVDDGQGGLLDVHVDQGGKKIYLTYSDPDAPRPTTSLFVGTLSSDKKTLSGKRLFQTRAFENGGMHFGSRIQIDDRGFIFISVGERNQRDMAQRLDTDQGKILRINKEGEVPSDNPFVGTKGALPEIWSYGHRNPQGLAIGPDGALWEAEFGPRGGDEINLIERGANYGWPVITYGREYYGPKIGTTAKEGMKQPIKYWVPSINPSGITIYQGKVFSGLQGNLLMASLLGHVHRVVLEGHKFKKEERLFQGVADRVRDVQVGQEGLIYFSSDDGKIFRVRPL